MARRTELKHDGITHSVEVSSWNGWALSLCGKNFSPKERKEPFFYGNTNCPDCIAAKSAKKKP